MIASRYHVATEWQPTFPGEPATLQTFPTLAEARQQGRENCCCAGALIVRVFDSVDAVHCVWHRADHYWHDLTPEAKQDDDATALYAQSELHNKAET